MNEAELLKKIIDLAFKDIDLLRCYQHYEATGEIIIFMNDGSIRE